MGPVHELTARATDQRPEVTTGSPASDDDEIGRLLARRGEQRVHGVAVDHQAPVRHRRVDEWSTPLLFESRGHLVSVPGRRHDGRTVLMRQQAEGMDGDDLTSGLSDEVSGPYERSPGVLGAVDPHQHMSGRAHILVRPRGWTSRLEGSHSGGRES